jgi:hypothetical protein
MKCNGIFLFVFLSAVVCVSGNVLAVLSGDGSQATPYLIQSRADFDEFADPNNAGIYWASGVYTKLMCDPNLSDTTYTQAVIAPDTINDPQEDFQGTKFSGIFDGNSHILSNLTIVASGGKDYVGLFGYVGAGGRINNLGLVNANLTGGSYVGGLAGKNIGSITSCYTTGSVSGGGRVGGLVGENYGSSAIVIFCYATGVVNGNYDVGGLVGENYSGFITSCYAANSVSGGADIGGLVGWNYGSSATISNCYATGSVTGTGIRHGGLVGDNLSGSINSCYATGSVSGTGDSVGGLVGEDSSSGLISACFWDTQTSGLTIGVGSGSTTGVTGKTTAQMQTLSTFTNVGWRVIYGTATLGEWILPDGDYPKLAWEFYTPFTIPNLKGLTEEQARTILSAAGLDVRETYSIYDTSIPTGFVSEIYPKSDTVVYIELTPVHILLAKESRYSGGIGTSESPFQMSTLADWQTLINISADWNKYFILTADIDFEGTFTTPISKDTSDTTSGFQGTKFTGLFDGKDFIIRNFLIILTNSDYVGLFGFVGTGGQIKNLGIENIHVHSHATVGGLAGISSGSITSCYVGGSVSGIGTYVGGLVGRNYLGTVTSCDATGLVSGSERVGGLAGQNHQGSITSCSATGLVSGSECVGGLVGFNMDSITSCYAINSVSGDNSVGGLAGWNFGSSAAITNCYATGTVSGINNYNGGLVGYSSGSIISCYATGLVGGSHSVGGLVGYSPSGSISVCFWDMDTSGLITSAGGTGKTTSEMMTLSTFTDAGWDFLEAANGTEDSWRMCTDDVSYPKLTWEYVKTGDFACPDGVAMDDFNRLSRDWLTFYASIFYGADADGDGTVGMDDLAILADNWL